MFDHGLSSALLPAAAGICVPILIGVSIVDLRERRIPNRALIAGLAAMAPAIAILAPVELPIHLTSMVVLGLPFGILSWFRPAGFGMGDAKLIAFIGFTLGARAPFALAVGFAAGALAGAALVIRRGLGARKASLAFAPFLSLGTFCALATDP